MIKKIFFSSIVMIMMVACTKETKEVSYTSPEGNVSTNFTATRSSSLDPWTLSINVKGYVYDETVMTELYIDDITKETIIVTWRDENSASIELKQRDGDNKYMSLSISNDHIQLQ